MAIRYLPEPHLCNRLSAGDEQAFREVFDRFHRKVFQFAFNFLKDNAQSEEIVQDTFLSLWLHRTTLNPDQPIAPFLFTIARRTLVDAWRKAAASERFRDQVRLFMDFSNNDTEEAVFKNELEQIAQDALSKLSDQQQEVFTLSRYEGLSYEEIAERMHISKNTVKYHLVNALKILRAHFGEHDVLYCYFILFLWNGN
ncbi:RNA polymerase sigma-70 factor, ECF subfamily [Parapedobacter luteus]|uniref:RNA polymerase sigma-70 factor, ECF subfamily n=1 Tax=Parapedobacter luteus TaxID=623280 RepID=A0A1T5AFX6_9SPHI|nr:RNA polymerase sigma-70 factor [Parapedobacter luteus]SKB33888.1 RNA polymerase sigma-70 factor, ECF subfamily [Parapedobacter luteus]